MRSDRSLSRTSRDYCVSLLMCCKVATLLLLLTEHSLNVCAESPCSVDSDCGPNSVCENGNCLCATGWDGETCEHCNGRTRLDDSSGYIIEAVDNYDTKTKCTWLVDGGRPGGATIRFIPESFGTECSWDYLFIYDGDSIYSPMVASLNGPIIHNEEIVTTSGYAYLYFYSDAAFTLEGFNISYSIDSCPGHGCSGHGYCDTYHLNCTCDSMWTGEACNTPACPSNCSGLGYCDEDAQACVCDPGFKGRDCATLEEEGLWEVMEDVIDRGRASASTILIGDTLLVVGGYAFDDSKNMTIMRYNLSTGTSEELLTDSAQGEMPRSRFAHTTVQYEDEFIVYGGSLRGRDLSAELWSFHYPTLTWAKMANGPHTLEGHTAHVIGDTMLVIFGYNPVYGYLNTVQEYNITSGNWSVVEARGAPVRGGYGHSSVLDPSGTRIYIHGGYKLRSRNDHTLTDDTYQYDVRTKSWSMLARSGLPRFLHSAVILNDLMLVFGGNTHTDGTTSTGAQCYSSDFLAYNIECGSWEMVNMTSGLETEIARFGHASFVHQELMWIYSGYNGLLTTSALLYMPGNCSIIADSSECMEGLPGLWCAWDVNNDVCVPADSVPELATNRTMCPEDNGPLCGVVDSCNNCLKTVGCGWCNDTCSRSCLDDIASTECSQPACDLQANCMACEAVEGCTWSNSLCKPGSGSASCGPVCDSFDGCQDCLSSKSNCMWCENQKRCVDSSTYMTSFPYGLCLEWRTSVESCPGSCDSHQTCDACQEDPACGWCDSGHRNGLGRCMEGSYTGPIDITGEEPELDYGMCPVSRWYFVECPSCQCNGHSECPQNSSECGPCNNNTEGDQCQTCQLGYYGSPENGGPCAACVCNGHSDICDQTSGDCYCDAKGVKGDKCESCDATNRYYGNPQDGGYCYYLLSINWQYTFNLSDGEDVNYTSIAMKTSPEVSNRDIKFNLEVSKPVYLNITYTSSDSNGEQMVIEGRTVNPEYGYSATFSRFDYDFTEEGNTTFYFYLSNFTTPITFQALYVEVQPDLLRYIAAALGAFIITLLVFFIGVRIQTCLLNRQQVQRRAVEMAVMASRPFATVNVDISKTAPPDIVAECQNFQTLAALEHCSDNKAGIMTVLMQLPMPGGDVPPFGQNRLAMASALVQLKPKKSEIREQRDREREQRDRERELRAQEREEKEQQHQQHQQQQRPPPHQQLPTAPLAILTPEDGLIVSNASIMNHEDARHLWHLDNAEYDNPAMV